jgi:hypothetical protein
VVLAYWPNTDHRYQIVFRQKIEVAGGTGPP